LRLARAGKNHKRLGLESPVLEAEADLGPHACPALALGLSCCMSHVQSGTIQLDDEPSMTRDEIYQVIVRSVIEVLPELEDHSFSTSDQLKQLGLDSLDRTDVIVMSLEALNLKIPLIETHGANNIGELAQLLHAKLHG
jgi:polyketide biosynthesis acyl carrier protein